MRRTQLKAQLEDLVDRTGRVEDMLDVLAGIYRERARTSRYRTDPDLHDAMLATADVLQAASEAVVGIFGEGEQIERQSERAAWQARHEEGRGNPAKGVSLNTVNAHLRARKIPVKAIRGAGYYYFLDQRPSFLDWPIDGSVYVASASHLTLQQWEAEAHEALARAEQDHG